MEAFQGAGKKEGIEIWRIEKFQAVPYPKSDYGKFFVGDSYIVLKTAKSCRDWDIFFWLGAETTQDESGTAAILSVKLDDFLGGAPIQHREVQDHESQLFLSLFSNGVRYVPGGVHSGFNHHEEVKETRLFHIKGKRNVRIKQVTPSIKSMNQGDCFILDNAGEILVYVGPNSRNVEKIKAINASNALRDQDHNGKARITIVDEYSPADDFTNFFNALGGGSREEVPDESSGGDDDTFEKNHDNVVTLHRVSDANGTLQVTKVGEKPLEQSLLDTNDCFILDTGSSLFVWVGKGCTPNEKRESMNTAMKFIKTKNYPEWTSIQKILEGCESGTFTQYFLRWKASAEKKKTLIRCDSNIADADWEPRLIHAQIPSNSHKFITEDIDNFKQEDLNEDDIMILDHGLKLFIWIGNGADDKEKQGCDALINSYLNKIGRPKSSVTVKKVLQGEETAEFKKGFPSWSDNIKKINYRDLLN